MKAIDMKTQVFAVEVVKRTSMMGNFDVNIQLREGERSWCIGSFMTQADAFAFLNDSTFQLSIQELLRNPTVNMTY
jgi:hypothetical protein